jgi:predicted nucleic acid-binding protein
LKIYLDNCCYNRPHDNYTDERSEDEVAAINAIIDICQQAKYAIIGSPIVMEEIDKTYKRKPEKWVLLRDFYARTVNTHIALTPKIIVRAHSLMALWPQKKDCHHLALAEAAGADVLLTTDDRFESANIRLNLSIVNVINPTTFLPEVQKWVQQ